MNLSCPICNNPLKDMNENDKAELEKDSHIYCCINDPAPINFTYGHYAVGFKLINNEIIYQQEDFIYYPYVIYKLYDNDNIIRYFVAQDHDQKTKSSYFRWFFNYAEDEFLNAFPNFNPKDISYIKEKFEVLDVFY